LEWARRYEEHDIKVLFGLPAEKLTDLDERMLKERENHPGECEDK